jgi:hypothetical protein
MEAALAFCDYANSDLVLSKKPILSSFGEVKRNKELEGPDLLSYASRVQGRVSTMFADKIFMRRHGCRALRDNFASFSQYAFKLVLRQTINQGTIALGSNVLAIEDCQPTVDTK